MANEKNEQVVNGTATPNEGQQVQQVPTEQIPVMVLQQMPQQPTEEKKPNWFKTHLKGILAGLAAVSAVAASGVAAYHKGKSLGAAQQMQQPMDYNDSPLNPNI